MKTLYQAGSAIEAHMLRDLLRQQGFSTEIHGEHLQGAIGELPAAGLVRLVVDDDDYPAARAVIDRWEAEQPAEAPKPMTATRSGGWPRFAIGLAIGVGATWAFHRTPTTVDGVDHNHDGVLDEKWTYAASGALLRTEIDRNLDGKVDYDTHHDRRGVVESAEADDNFDGIFETRMRFRDGNVELYEVDTDGDGIADRRSHFASGVLTTTDIVNPATGLPLRVEYYRLGVLIKADVDTDKDGVLDTRFFYTPLGEVSSSEKIQP
jgi:hypothetical protein